MRTHFDQLARAMRVVATAALGFGGAFLIWKLKSADGGTPMVARLVISAMLALLLTVGTVVGDGRRLRRHFGSAEQFNRYSRALRTGDLPTRIESDMWRGWLDYSRNENRSLRWSAAWTVAVGLVLPVTRPAQHHWLIGLLVALIGIGGLASWWFERRRIVRLSTAVEQRVGATSSD